METVKKSDLPISYDADPLDTDMNGPPFFQTVRFHPGGMLIMFDTVIASMCVVLILLAVLCVGLQAGSADPMVVAAIICIAVLTARQMQGGRR